MNVKIYIYTIQYIVGEQFCLMRCRISYPIGWTAG